MNLKIYLNRKSSKYELILLIIIIITMMVMCICCGRTLLLWLFSCPWAPAAAAPWRIASSLLAAAFCSR